MKEWEYGQTSFFFIYELKRLSIISSIENFAHLIDEFFSCVSCVLRELSPKKFSLRSSIMNNRHKTN